MSNQCFLYTKDVFNCLQSVSLPSPLLTSSLHPSLSAEGLGPAAWCDVLATLVIPIMEPLSFRPHSTQGRNFISHPPTAPPSLHVLMIYFHPCLSRHIGHLLHSHTHTLHHLTLGTCELFVRMIKQYPSFSPKQKALFKMQRIQQHRY